MVVWSSGCIVAEIYLVWGAAGKPVVRDEHLPLYKYGRKKLKTKRKIQLLGDVQLRRGHRSAVFQEVPRLMVILSWSRG